jgi:hypothetical protein
MISYLQAATQPWDSIEGAVRGSQLQALCGLARAVPGARRKSLRREQGVRAPPNQRGTDKPSRPTLE